MPRQHMGEMVHTTELGGGCWEKEILGSLRVGSGYTSEGCSVAIMRNHY